MHPEFTAHGSLEHLKLGKKPYRPDLRTLMLADYIDDEQLLPQIPETFDRRPKVATWPMYGNDRLGDCTWAAIGHIEEDWTAEALGLEHMITPPTPDIEEGYWLTGDPPSTTGTAGGPTDDGRDELSVLQYCHKHGIPGGHPTDGHPFTAYAYVAPSNHNHMRAALYLFGSLYTGTALPLTAQRPTQGPGGESEWDVVANAGAAGEPGSWGGHAYPNRAVWDGKTLRLITWGYEMVETLAFSDKYKEEAWAVLSPDWLNGGKSIDGFDAQQLKSDLQHVQDTPEAA
jgi:hypothetical protein